MFGNFGRYVTNPRGTFIENLKKVQNQPTLLDSVDHTKYIVVEKCRGFRRQGCGSGSGFRDFVDPDLYWESGSRGKKTKKFQWKNALFSYFLKNFTPKKV
jgi:hypothetical protein